VNDWELQVPDARWYPELQTALPQLPVEQLSIPLGIALVQLPQEVPHSVFESRTQALLLPDPQE